MSHTEYYTQENIEIIGETMRQKMITEKRKGSKIFVNDTKAIKVIYSVGLNSLPIPQPNMNTLPPFSNLSTLYLFANIKYYSIKPNKS